MKQIRMYIVEMWDDHITGFTTYKNELINSLSLLCNVRLNIISLRCPAAGFRLTTRKDGVIIYECPGRQKDVSEVSCALLGLHIEDRIENVFFFNFCPCAEWIISFRRYFSLCNIVYVIHDFMWASFLLGDVKKLRDIIANKYVDDRSKRVMKSYRDGAMTFEKSDRIVCLSNDTSNLLQSVYKVPKDKLVTIHNGLYDYTSKKQYNKRSMLRAFSHIDNPKVLLYVGRISVQKGAYDLIKAFIFVAKHYPNTVLVMAGDFNSSLLKMIPDSMKSKILLLGCISHTELCQWYQVAAWGVVPSYYEQCSYTGIEMKKYGLPIIASNGFGIRDMFTNSNSVVAPIVHHGRNSEYFCELANAITKALSFSESQRLKYGILSRKDFETRYNVSIMSEGYMQLLSEISNK